LAKLDGCGQLKPQLSVLFDFSFKMENFCPATFFLITIPIPIPIIINTIHPVSMASLFPLES
jgi:hypothetical protein